MDTGYNYSGMNVRELQKEETRANILQAATRLFTQRSINAVTMQEIADEAQVAKGSVFHHFSSKDELSSVVLQNVMHLVMKDFDLMLKKIRKDSSLFNSELRKTIVAMFDYELEHPFLFKYILDYMRTYGVDLASEDSPLMMKFAGYIDKFTASFELGGIKNPEPRAMMFFSMLDGLILQLEFNTQYSQQVLPSLIDELMKVIEFWQAED